MVKKTIATGAASWTYRYRAAGKIKKFTLGSYPKIRLREARTKAAKLRAAIISDRDPMAEKQETRRKARLPVVVEDHDLVEKVILTQYGASFGRVPLLKSSEF